MPKGEKRKIISLNEMADVIQNYSAGKIDSLLAPLLDLKSEPAMVCDNRCGCIGSNCDCRGQVGMVSIEESDWRRLQKERLDLAASLKRAIEEK